jgi:hypothetical protein
MKRAHGKHALRILCTAALIALHASEAGAQAPTTAQKSQARDLADEGERQFNAGNYKKAYELFVQAEALVHRLPFLVMAARSQERMGSLVEARALYERVVAEDLGANPKKQLVTAQEEAKKGLEAIKPRIPSVQIVLTRAPSNVRVRIDGAEVPPERIGQPVEVNPGTRRIVASVSGMDKQSASVTLKEGARDRVELTFSEGASPSSSELASAPSPPFVEDPSSSAHPPPAPTARPMPSGAPSSLGSNGAPQTSAGSPFPAIIAFAVGGAGVLTGVVAGALFISNNKTILSQCPGNQCPQRLADDIDDAKTMGRLALAGLIIGAAGIGVGTWLVVTSPDPTSTPSTVTQVWLGPSSIGVRGTF